VPLCTAEMLVWPERVHLQALHVAHTLP
jgi:hypothetical protein